MGFVPRKHNTAIHDQFPIAMASSHFLLVTEIVQTQAETQE